MVFFFNSTNLFCEVNVFPAVFVKLVSICQQSEDIVSSITVSPKVFVWDPCFFFSQLKGMKTKKFRMQPGIKKNNTNEWNWMLITKYLCYSQNSGERQDGDKAMCDENCCSYFIYFFILCRYFRVFNIFSCLKSSNPYDLNEV